VCVRTCVRAYVHGTIRLMFKTSNNEAVQEMAAVETLLYGCEILYEMKQDDTRVETAEMNIFRLAARYVVVV